MSFPFGGWKPRLASIAGLAMMMMAVFGGAWAADTLGPRAEPATETTTRSLGDTGGDGRLGSALSNSSTGPTTAATGKPAESIPWNELGARAEAQYQGNGLMLSATEAGAALRCVFQQIEGQITSAGLWLVSTVEAGGHDRFQVVARSLGREGQPYGRPLARTGTVAVADRVARFIRPGMVEEYSVSMDGVRQDFVVLERPAGRGAMRVELEVAGAKAAAAAYGARLVLAGSGREIAYGRLRVADAHGRALDARLEPTSAGHLAIVVDDADAAYPVRIDPTFSDADWVSMGNPPGFDATVRAAVVDGTGNLYVGGDFTIVGNLVANRVAKWNGSAWSALGTGLNYSVYALAVSGSDLYVGGYFTTAGGSSANRIARWDGSAWSALGTGVNGPVFALAVSGTELYVGGYFDTAGGISANQITKWDGSTWSALGTGVNSWVLALAVSGTELYVGGYFTTAGGSSANGIARWDGSTWSALGTGVNGPGYALVVSGTELYVGGDFTTAGASSANRIARWNGSMWSALGTGLNGSVYALAVSGSDLYVGGGFTTAGGSSANQIARWNGSAWSALGTGLNNAVYALAVSGSDLYVGGDFTTAGGSSANRIAKRNGSAWSAVGLQSDSGLNNAVLALAVSGTDLYVGGSFTTAGGSSASRIARWNGSAWSALGTGLNNPVSALAVSGSDLYVGGGFTTAGSISAIGIAKWNGSSWSALGIGLNNAAAALAVSGTDLYVGGGFTTAGGISANRIARWDGSAWSALGTGLNDLVLALAVSGPDLYVGGNFTTAGGGSANRIAKWNGSAWSALGTGLNDLVFALAVSGPDLYVGGNFTTAGGGSANRIAKWNGSAWSVLGTGLSNLVYALAVSGADLYVGGNFTTAGGISANQIARWNGSAWSALGTGLNSTVMALTVSGPDLYVGGFFTTAGDKVSLYAAKALGACNAPSIVQQPASQVAAVGGSATLSVAASGSTPLDYQWFASYLASPDYAFPVAEGDGAAGVNTASLVLTGLTTCRGEQYICRVINACDTAWTTAATLTVQPARPVPPLIHQFGQPGSGPGEFVSSYAIALDRADTAYVLDHPIRIQKFTPSGEFVLQWYPGPSGRLNEVFYPTGLAVDDSGNVYVAYYADHRIKKFTSSGQFLVQWGTLGSGPDNLNGPYGIAIDRDNFVYVTDIFNERIQKFDRNGQHIDDWPAADMIGITVDPQGDVYVCGGTGIHKYAPDGILIESRPYGEDCADGVVRFYPVAIATDSCGNLVVADRINYRVQIFGPDGQFLRNWGRAGTDSAGIMLADGIAVGRTGNVYVVDDNLMTVKVFAAGLDSTCDSCSSSLPIIVNAHPATQSVSNGQTAALSVNASGPGVLGYVWTRDGTTVADGPNLSGQFTPTLTILHAQDADAGSYQAIVSNACDTIPSLAAAVAVSCPVERAPAPSPMGAWWSIDESPSSPYVADLLRTTTRNRATRTGASSLVPGLRGNALRCLAAADGAVLPHGQLTILFQNAREFATDAWIYPRSGSPAGAIRTIIAKNRFHQANGPGFAFYLTGSGRLGVELHGSSGNQRFESASAMTMDAWHHVAVSVRQGSSGGALYVDGVRVHAFTAPAYNVVCTGDLSIGRFAPVFQAFSADSAFNGDIDELEWFRAPVDSGAVSRIWAAGCASKRREFAVLPVAATFCRGRTSIRICPRIANFDPVPHSYDWSIALLPPGPSCPPASAVTFVPSSGTVSVPAARSQVFPVMVQAPVTPSGIVNACYRLTVSRPGEPPFTVDGRITTSVSQYCTTPPCQVAPAPAPSEADEPALPLAAQLDATVASTTSLRFVVHNDSTASGTYSYQVAAIDPDTELPSDRIGLGGESPGTPLMGSVPIAALDSAEVVVNAAVNGYDPFLTHQVLLYSDDDGDGLLDAIAAVPIETAEDTTSSSVGVDFDPPITSVHLDAAPNPFQRETVVSFTLGEARQVEIGVFDVAGRLVRTLQRGRLPVGQHRFAWDGRGLGGRQCAGGLYFIRMKSAGTTLSTKVVQIR